MLLALLKLIEGVYIPSTEYSCVVHFCVSFLVVTQGFKCIHARYWCWQEWYRLTIFKGMFIRTFDCLQYSKYEFNAIITLWVTGRTHTESIGLQLLLMCVNWLYHMEWSIKRFLSICIIIKKLGFLTYVTAYQLSLEHTTFYTLTSSLHSSTHTRTRTRTHTHTPTHTHSHSHRHSKPANGQIWQWPHF